MIAAGQADEIGLLRTAGVAPVVRAHLQRDLGGRGAVAGVEGVAQAGQRAEALRQLHHRLVRQSGQHHVIERVELARQRGLHARVAVAEQVDPPGADRVEVAPAVGVDQPRPFGARDREQRLGFEPLHLRAGMPDRAAAALGQRVGSGHRGGR